MKNYNLFCGSKWIVNLTAKDKQDAVKQGEALTDCKSLTAKEGNDITYLIEKRITALGLQKQFVAEQAGITKTNFSRRLSGLVKFTNDELNKIDNIINYSKN